MVYHHIHLSNQDERCNRQQGYCLNFKGEVPRGRERSPLPASLTTCPMLEILWVVLVLQRDGSNADIFALFVFKQGFVVWQLTFLVGFLQSII